jgi:hypothetical protein
MPAIKVKRKWWLLQELQERWKLSLADMHRLVMDETLRPCLMLETELHPVEVIDGKAAVLKDELVPVAKTWLYPIYPQQVGPFDCVFESVSDQARPVEGCTLWGLPVPMTLEDVMRLGVVMEEDMQEAEAALTSQQDDELHGKERITLYRLLVTSVVEQYGWDPTSERSTAVPDLVRDAEALGLSVSYNAAKEHLRRAWEKCPPQGVD